MKTKKMPIEESFLLTIRTESKNVKEYAKRAEAWNASEAAPYSDMDIATFYAFHYAMSRQFIVDEMMRCRTARKESQKTLWTTLTNNL